MPFRPHAQSGSLLASAMREVGVARADVAITNVIRCRPPKDWLEGAPYQFAATNHCITHHLIPAIQELKPKAILALGGTAMRALIAGGRGKAYTLDYARGFAWQGAGAAEGVPVVPTYHPAFIRRGAAHLTPLLWRDLKYAYQIAMGRASPVLDPRGVGLRYQTAPTIREAWDWVGSLDPDLPLAFDIETPMSVRSDEDERTSFTDRDIKLVQFTQRRGEGLALPYRDEYRDVVRSAFQSARVKVGFNNWNFDDPVLAANGIDVGQTHDAMILFHSVYPDLPANLQAVAGWCGFPFAWKHYAGDELEWYGCADVDATLAVWEFMTGMMNA